VSAVSRRNELSGLKLKAGDEVTVLDQNYLSHSVAWDGPAARCDFTVKRMSLDAERLSESSERF